MSEVLIYILLTLGALLVIILVAPIHFGFWGEYSDSLSYEGRLGWAGGFFSLEVIRSEGRFNWALGFLGVKKSNLKSSDKDPGSKKTGTPKKRSRSRRNISSFINLQLFREVKALFHKLVRALHLDLNLSGIYGFDDPSLTGITVGAIAVLSRGSSSVDLYPDFTREVVDIRGSIRGWIIPLQILGIGVVFLLKKPVRTIWWPNMKFHKKQKEVVQYV